MKRVAERRAGLRGSFVLAVALVLLGGQRGVTAAEIRVGVAANFTSTLSALAQGFERRTGHHVILSSGSTGKLYAQIKQGAPFDLFFAADEARPRRLEREGDGVVGTRFTYATGRIVLWSPDPGRVDGTAKVLSMGTFTRLAIANPATAPYGAAAQQALEKLGLWKALQSRLVRGENIAQTFQFVASGNAELGFVALSQLRSKKGMGGSLWEVPETDYQPIAQQVILLRHARAPQAARQLLEYLHSPEALKVLQRFGYGVGN